MPNADTRPGVSWYRSRFRLNVPPGVDASLGLTITDTPSKSYRAQIFLNGWNVGQYINNVGPQTTFVLPTGLLQPRGENTLAIAVLADGSTTGGAGQRDAGQPGHGGRRGAGPPGAGPGPLAGRPLTPAVGAAEAQPRSTHPPSL